jgi:hypothetical protein
MIDATLLRCNLRYLSNTTPISYQLIVPDYAKDVSSASAKIMRRNPEVDIRQGAIREKSGQHLQRDVSRS